MPDTDISRSAVLTVLAENEPGVLCRVAGLFTGRGYNIDSLAVAAVGDGLARFTIVTSGTDMAIEQVQAQVARIVPVHSVSELMHADGYVARELALMKVVANGADLQAARDKAAAFGARELPASDAVLIFELSGETAQLDAFTDALRNVGLVEAARTGITALSYGKETT